MLWRSSRECPPLNFWPSNVVRRSKSDGYGTQGVMEGDRGSIRNRRPPLPRQGLGQWSYGCRECRTRNLPQTAVVDGAESWYPRHSWVSGWTGRTAKSRSPSLSCWRGTVVSTGIYTGSAVPLRLGVPIVDHPGQAAVRRTAPTTL